MDNTGDMMTTEAVTETVTENLTETTVYPDWWWDAWKTIFKAKAERQAFRDKWLDFSSIWASVLCCVSLITNGLCILTFATKKSKKEQTVNTFLIALAIADSFSLVNAWNNVAMYWTGTSVMTTSNAGCKIVPYIGNIARDCSYYITLGFTIDRFISVTVPLKRALCINKARVRAYLVALVITFCGCRGLCTLPRRVFQQHWWKTGLRDSASRPYEPLSHVRAVCSRLYTAGYPRVCPKHLNRSTAGKAGD